MTKKVAINVEIKNIKKVADLKKELKDLRKTQREYEKAVGEGQKVTKKAAKGYSDSAKAIKTKSKSLRDLNKSLSTSSTATKGATKSTNSLSRSFVKAAAAIGIVVGAFRLVSRALSAIVSTFSEFEFVMAKVNAVSGATKDEFEALTQSAEDLGRSTFFTATQVGELQLAYSKLGFTAQEILDATAATLDLATATGTDLARAAQVAGASIRGFQLEASEARRVVDVMAVAFSSSALDIEKWNTSMTKVAPIAAMAGFEIEEVAAIMGKLTDTGIEASIAGTSLRNIFLKMQDPSSELSKTVGHTITNLDGMLLAFKELQDAGTDLTDVLSFMDVRQVAAFGTMLEGSDDIEVLRQKLLEATGEGERMSDMVGDTLQGSFLKLKSAIQGLYIYLMKTYGKGLQEMVQKMAAWLNKMVETDGAIAIFMGKLKLAVKIIASYVIGTKIATMWTKFMASSFMTTAMSAGVATGAITVLRGALALLKTAIISTGIGLLVIMLGEWVSGMMSVNDGMNSLIDVEKDLNKGMKDTNVEIEIIRKRTEKLIRVRKEYTKLLDKEGNLLKKGKVAQAEYNKLKDIEAKTMKDLNVFHKKYNTNQISVEDSNQDIIQSTKDLTQAMKDLALAGIFATLESKIMGIQVAANLVEKDFTKRMKALGRNNSTVMMEAVADIDRYIKAGNKMNNAGIIKKMLADYDISKTQFKEVMSIKYGFDNEFASAEAKGADGYYTIKLEELKKEIAAMTSTDFDDLFSGGTDDDDGDGGKAEQDAIFEMNEIIKKHKDKVYAQRIVDEKDNQKALLNAAIKGTQEYLDQYKGKEDKNKMQVLTGNIRMGELLRKQRKANDAQALEDLRVQASRELTIAKEGLALKVLSEFEYAEQVYLINKQLLEDEYNLLTEKEKLGKKGADIKAKQATLELNMVKTNITEEERLLTQAYDEQVKALELEQSTTMMSQMEFDNRMLQLEADFLAKKAELHAGNALVLIDINNDILANNIEVNKQQKQMMEEQISAMGGVGSALTSLAGDNEKLNFIKEAGNKISQVANIISTVTALKADLETLSTIKKNAAKIIGNTTEEASILLDKEKIITTNIKTVGENINTGANITNTVSEGANTAATLTNTIATTLSLIPKAISAILTSAMSLPFPINLVAIIATMALVRKVMKFEEGGIVGNKYANGGMVHGKSHAQGGEKFAVGGRVVELEGGEAVINKRSTAKYKSQLSAINADGGGVKFADGGLLNSPAFAQQQFSMDRRGGAQKVYVVESDISSTQKSVNVLEAAATL